jgi:hypothetical protein
MKSFRMTIWCDIQDNADPDEVGELIFDYVSNFPEDHPLEPMVYSVNGWDPA